MKNLPNDYSRYNGNKCCLALKSKCKRRKAYCDKRKALRDFETAVNNLIRAFEHKHGYQFTGFVADDPSGIATFIEEYFFSIGNIYTDLKRKAPQNIIFEWHDHIVENDVNINFNSYLMGARVEMFNKVK